MAPNISDGKCFIALLQAVEDLATYAKLNGVPWLLRMNRTDAHELLIGLGSAEVREGRLGERERVVGITTVFGGDGDYYLSNVSKAVRMDKYWECRLAVA